MLVPAAPAGSCRLQLLSQQGPSGCIPSWCQECSQKECNQYGFTLVQGSLSFLPDTARHCNGADAG